MKPRRKVLVIGLDGMTDLSLHGFVRSGQMPFVGKLIEEGSEGTLMSTMPPVTGPAWASFFTGRNPGSHGILDFFAASGDGRTRRLVNSRSVSGKTLWEILDESGKTQVVVNTPLTYPATPVRGAMITGMLTPLSNQDLTWPTDLYERLEPELGEYTITVNWQDYSHESAGRFLEDLRRCNNQRTRYVLRLMDEFDADFTMATFTGTDRVHHALWHYVDPAIRETLGDRYDPAVMEGVNAYFRQLDANIEAIVDRAGPEAAVFFVSDHGFGPLDRKVFVNNWLEKKGLLKIRHNRLRAYRAAVSTIRTIRKIGKAMRPRWMRSGGGQRAALANLAFYHVFYHSVDWSRTRAYMASNSEQGIYVNLAGREPFGIVDPADYDAVRQEVHEALRAMTDDAGGSMLTRFHRREDVYSGPFVERAPDVIFALDEGASLAEIHLGGGKIFRDVSWKTGSGNHRMEGYFLARGEGIRRGSGLVASIMDVMPTILYYLGLPVPSDLDGSPIDTVFSDEFREREQPVFAGTATSGPRHEGERFSRTEEAELQDRLRRLGYMD